MNILIFLLALTFVFISLLLLYKSQIKYIWDMILHKFESALKIKLANKTIKIFLNGLIIFLLAIVINLPNLSAQENTKVEAHHIQEAVENLKTAKGFTKEVILQALGKTHDPKVVEPLVNIMLYDTSSDFKNVTGPDVRTMAAIEISNLASHVRYVNKYSLNENVEELKETLKKIAIPALIKVLNSNDEKPKSNAAIALYELGHPEALIYLDQLAQQGYTSFKIAFSYINKKGDLIWDENAKVFCLKAINYNNDRVKVLAAQCLADLGNKEEKELANNISVNILSNGKDEKAREDALFVLEKIGDEKSIAVVEKALQDTDDFVKKEAKRVLNKLKKEKGK